MNIVIIGCSLVDYSRSRVLAKQIAKDLNSQGAQATFHDLRDYDLAFAGAPGAYQKPDR